MTKDLSLLVGPDQPWLSTIGFLDSIDGRDTEAQTDFDDAKNEQPLLLTTS